MVHSSKGPQLRETKNKPLRHAATNVKSITLSDGTGSRAWRLGVKDGIRVRLQRVSSREFTGVLELRTLLVGAGSKDLRVCENSQSGTPQKGNMTVCKCEVQINKKEQTDCFEYQALVQPL